VALVGDAAYCPSLLAGQGAAFAMAGAYLLAGELHRAQGDYAKAFRNYQRRLHGFVSDKQRAAEWLGGWFAPKTAAGLFVRDEVTRLLSLPWIGPWLVRRMVADRFPLPDYAG
jgi:2-polyprenyl-6-methoxyphenol hydroxylase-like FAD-dependent oxidoreductase